jgi:hypothetical protein
MHTVERPTSCSSGIPDSVHNMPVSFSLRQKDGMKPWSFTVSLHHRPVPLSSALCHVWRYCPLSSYQMFILP